MIVGAIGASDQIVGAVLNRLTEAHPRSTVSQSIREGVAIGCWNGSGLARSSYGGDFACSGSWRGEFPGPSAALRGDYALVARHGARLRLARARFAGRPIYWARLGSVVVASDHVLPLLILGRRGLELNLEHVFALFEPRLRLYVGPLPFAGAQRVPANSVLDIDRAGHTHLQTGPFELEPELRLSARDLARALRSELETAVARQCQGSRRVAVFTGGGVDSSNLLAVAVNNARTLGTADVLPMAFDFGGPGDDRPYLKALCTHLRVEPHRVAPAEGAPYAGQDRIVDASAHATAPLPMMIAALTQARQAGAERALLGDGSEILLDAFPPVFGDFLLHHPLRALRCAAEFQAIGQSRGTLLRTLLAGPLLRTVLPSAVIERRAARAHRLRVARTIAGAPWMGRRLRDFIAVERSYPGSPPHQSQAHRVASLRSSEHLTSYMESATRWEMITGLPISYPYLDDDFVRFTSRIPSEAIFAGARERGLLREAMEGIVPDTVRYRMDKAVGDQAFAETFCAMGRANAVGDLPSMRELEKLGLVDGALYARAFDKFAADPYADPLCWFSMWSAITAEDYVRWFADFKAKGPGRAASSRPNLAVS